MRKPFTKAGPGRPKGLRNKTTIEVANLSRNLVENPEYLASLKQRLIDGKAPHMETLLFHYAYGKPVDRIQLMAPMITEVNRLADAYGLTAAEILAEAESMVNAAA